MIVLSLHKIDSMPSSDIFHLAVGILNPLTAMDILYFDERDLI
jgi:hypothetical protein